jgi:hypothetical protein
MSTLTENRLGFYRQGAAFTAANTTYPVDIVLPYINNVGHPDNSNTNGVRMPERYANQRVAIRVTCRADTAPTCGVAVYGYVRQVLATTNTGIAAANTFTTNGYTSVLTGTIDPAASTAVVGVGTLFTTELVIGDYITVTGQTRQVTAITDNTNLTVGSAFSDNANDTSPDRGNIETNPWDHLLNLNNSVAIATTTNALGAISVIAVGEALGFVYNEVITVGGMYERIRCIPVVLTGTNPRCLIDVAFAGGQR